MRRKKMKVLNLKEELKKRFGKLDGKDWYFGCGERTLNAITMDEARDLLLCLQFLEKKEVRFDQTTLPFWHRFLQTDDKKRMEFVKMMLSSLPFGGTCIVDLRITAQIEKYFNRPATTIKAVLVEENNEDKIHNSWNGLPSEADVIYDKFHYETCLWDGPFAKDYAVPPLPEYSHGYTNHHKKYDEGRYYRNGEIYRHEVWSRGMNWVNLLLELYGGNVPSESQKVVRGRIIDWLSSHLTSVSPGNILLRDVKTGQHRTISADRYFDENGKAYDPETIYALRLYFEIDGKIPVIPGWETKDTGRAIRKVTAENPIISVPAYNMKWNDDIVIHSSLLNGAHVGIKGSVVDMV